MKVIMGMNEYKKLEEYKKKYDKLSKCVTVNFIDIATLEIDESKPVTFNLREMLETLELSPSVEGLVPKRMDICITKECGEW